MKTGGRFRLALVFAVLCAVVLGASYVIVDGYAWGKAHAQLERTQRNLATFVNDEYTRIMAFTASALVSEIGSAQRLPDERLRGYMRLYRLDEIGIADTNGVWIVSTVADVPGMRLVDSPETEEFLQTLTGGVHMVAQEFRESVVDSASRRKYLAMRFPDRSGLLEIGIDESRLSREFRQIFDGLSGGWSAAGGAFVIISDGLDDATVTECGHPGFRGEAVGRRLSEIGLTKEMLAGEDTASAVLEMFGEQCFCRSFTFAGRRCVVVLPFSQNRDEIILVMSLTAALLVLVSIVAWIVIRFVGTAQKAEERLRDARTHELQEEHRRQAEDLAVARDIQRSSLPSIFPPYPRDLMIDIFASMDPARDVGGDFYDFHYVGTDRLAVLVADVAGKGVPAAMFMMKAKTILRSLALSVNDLGEAVEKVNRHLCEGNSTDMFVTCWIGVIDERSGVVTYVNAGHNPPYIRRKDGSLVKLDSVSGLFLGGMESVTYRVFSAQLHSGDQLFLYTDGVTEANNPLGGMFGESRLEEVLTGRRALGLARFTPGGGGIESPRELCRRMRNAVDSFAGSAAQFDDITMVALHYRGMPSDVASDFPAELASVPKMSAFAERLLNESSCPELVKCDLLVALDEVSNNVARYSKARRMSLRIETAVNPSVWRFTVSDDGIPWNPLEHLDPDVTLSADDRPIGGLGILMVKRLMDDVSYSRTRGRNVFRFRKGV